MQYRLPVSDRRCPDGAVHASATLTTRPHAAFAHHSILGCELAAVYACDTRLSVAHCMQAVEQLRCNTAGL